MQKYITLNDEIDEKALKDMAEIIKNGGIGIFPTETVYGIGANAFDKTAVEKIYEVKQRPKEKPINVLVSNFEMIEKIAPNITEKERKIIEKFFPGPITIILDKNDKIPDIVTAGRNKIGVRVPANNIALKLIEYAGVPIATPSANISGKPSGTNIKEILKDFNGKVDFVIDNGESKIGQASTIVQVIDEKVNILREGTITKEEIEQIL